MIIAILIGIIGSILEGFNKLLLIALLMSLLSVISYFFISKGILFKVFLFSSLILIIANEIINRKKHTGKKRGENYETK